MHGPRLRARVLTVAVAAAVVLPRLLPRGVTGRLFRGRK